MFRFKRKILFKLKFMAEFNKLNSASNYAEFYLSNLITIIILHIV